MNKEKIISIIEDMGWSVREDENYISINCFSPYGQDVNFDIEKENIEKNIKELCDNYDPAYEALLWVDDFWRGKRGAPDLPELLEDMQWVKEELQLLCDSLDCGYPVNREDVEKIVITIKNNHTSNADIIDMLDADLCDYVMNGDIEDFSIAME